GPAADASQHPAGAVGQPAPVRLLRIRRNDARGASGLQRADLGESGEAAVMSARRWVILAAVALARAGFGYQYQTVATLGPDLMRLFDLDYATLGTLIGAFMLLGAFLAL